MLVEESISIEHNDISLALSEKLLSDDDFVRIAPIALDVSHRLVLPPSPSALPWLLLLFLLCPLLRSHAAGGSEDGERFEIVEEDWNQP